MRWHQHHLSGIPRFNREHTPTRRRLIIKRSRDIAARLDSGGLQQAIEQHSIVTDETVEVHLDKIFSTSLSNIDHRVIRLDTDRARRRPQRIDRTTHIIDSDLGAIGPIGISSKLKRQLHHCSIWNWQRRRRNSAARRCRGIARRSIVVRYFFGLRNGGGCWRNSARCRFDRIPT